METLAKLYFLILHFIVPKMKFAFTSVIATAFDYVLYLILFYNFFSPEVSNIISYSCAVVLNFTLQKKYVFTIKGKVQSAFLMSMTFSLIGLVLSTIMISVLNKLDVFFQYQFLTKIIVTGIIFFYNYYTKRFSFERR